MVLIYENATKAIRDHVFPSPCGDYGSYHPFCAWQTFSFVVMFPSPCGDYGSYQYFWKQDQQKKEEGFRPLAGIMVLIASTNKLYILDYIKFPSPCGDYGSYPFLSIWDSSKKHRKFPSPCGDYGSYPSRCHYRDGRRLQKVSVPLRGLWFLS